MPVIRMPVGDYHREIPISNCPDDVIFIQRALNWASVKLRFGTFISEDSCCGRETIEAIRRFQQANNLSIDGRISPRGETLLRLLEVAKDGIGDTSTPNVVRVNHGASPGVVKRAAVLASENQNSRVQPSTQQPLPASCIDTAKTDTFLKETSKRDLQREHQPPPKGRLVPLGPATQAVWLNEKPSRQWGTPATIEAIHRSAERFFQRTNLRVGVNDISFEKGGPMSPHKTHQNGRGVDIRLIRADKAEQGGIKYWEKQYSHELTQILVDCFAEDENVGSVLFNDPKVIKADKTKKTRHCGGHDHHLHVNFKQ